MSGADLMTAQERAEEIKALQENTQSVFRLLREGSLSVEQGRLALELLQLMTDLLDLADAVARRTQTKQRGV